GHPGVAQPLPDLAGRCVRVGDHRRGRHDAAPVHRGERAVEFRHGHRTVPGSDHVRLASDHARTHQEATAGVVTGKNRKRFRPRPEGWGPCPNRSGSPPRKIPADVHNTPHGDVGGEAKVSPVPRHPPVRPTLEQRKERAVFETTPMTHAEDEAREVGVGPWQGPWPEGDHYDPELLASGDRRNVVDRYRYWRREAII